MKEKYKKIITLSSIVVPTHGIITPHAQLERGKVIDRGVHICDRT